MRLQIWDVFSEILLRSEATADKLPKTAGETRGAPRDHWVCGKRGSVPNWRGRRATVGVSHVDTVSDCAAERGANSSQREEFHHPPNWDTTAD